MAIGLARGKIALVKAYCGAGIGQSHRTSVRPREGARRRMRDYFSHRAHEATGRRQRRATKERGVIGRTVVRVRTVHHPISPSRRMWGRIGYVKESSVIQTWGAL